MPALFPYRPNTATPALERYEWLTDIQYTREYAAVPAWQRRTYRVPLRNIPRISLEFSVLAAGDEATELRALLSGSAIHQDWVLPLWHHIVRADDTLSRYQLAPYVVYLHANGTLSTDISEGALYKMPGVLARLESGAGGKEHSAGVHEYALRFNLAPLAYFPAVAGSIPAPTRTSPRPFNTSREVQGTVDFGRAWSEDLYQARERRTTDFEFTLAGADIADALAFFFMFKGGAHAVSAHYYSPPSLFWPDLEGEAYLSSDALEVLYLTPTLAKIAVAVEELL